MSKFAKRIDLNHTEITGQLRELGWSVYSTHFVGRGFPDLIICKSGINYIVEIKANDKKQLTKSEQDFYKNFVVIKGSTVEDIIKEIMLYEYFLYRALKNKYEQGID